MHVHAAILLVPLVASFGLSSLRTTASLGKRPVPLPMRRAHVHAQSSRGPVPVSPPSGSRDIVGAGWEALSRRNVTAVAAIASVGSALAATSHLGDLLQPLPALDVVARAGTGTTSIFGTTATSANVMVGGTGGPIAPEAAALLAEGDTIVRSLWLMRLVYPTVVGALEIGLFEALANRPLTHEQLARRVQPPLPPRALEAITSTCAALGILLVSSPSPGRGNGIVALVDAVRPFLLRGSKFFAGPLLLAADGTHASLRRALAKTSSNAAHHVDDMRHAHVGFEAHSEEALQSFTASMEAHSSATAVCTAQVLNLSGRRRLLDMAGGSGCFARALARANPSLKATVADVPAVVKMHDRGDFVEHDIRARVCAQTADLFDASTWPRGHDVVLLANVLHDWSNQECRAILQAARDCLPPAGECVVVEVLMDEDRAGPLPAALYGVSMLLGDWRSGKQYSFQDIKAMLVDAGFGTVGKGPSCGPFHTAIRAVRQ